MRTARTAAGIALALCLACGLVCLAGCAKNPQVTDCGIMHESEFGGAYITVPIAQFNEQGFEYGDSVDVTFSNGYKLEGIPYYNGYYADSGDPQVVAHQGYEYIKVLINNGDDLWGVAELSTDMTASVELVKHGEFLNIQKACDIRYTDVRDDFETDEDFANFRSVRAGAIVPNMLYRSASICDNVHNRAPFADALAASAGVNYVVNLVDSADDIEDEFLDDDSYETPYFKDLYNEGYVALLTLNTNYASDEFKEKLAAGLVALSEHHGPYLVHCTDGMDRTGFACMVLEALCGASYDEIIADFMGSYASYYGITKEDDADRYKTLVEHALNPMLYCMVGDEDVNLKKADLAVYAEEYLRAGGMTDEQIVQLKAALTEHPTLGRSVLNTSTALKRANL